MFGSSLSYLYGMDLLGALLYDRAVPDGIAESSQRFFSSPVPVSCGCHGGALGLAGLALAAPASSRPPSSHRRRLRGPSGQVRLVGDVDLLARLYSSLACGTRGHEMCQSPASSGKTWAIRHIKGREGHGLLPRTVAALICRVFCIPAGAEPGFLSGLSTSMEWGPLPLQPL